MICRIGKDKGGTNLGGKDSRGSNLSRYINTRKRDNHLDLLESTAQQSALQATLSDAPMFEGPRVSHCREQLHAYLAQAGYAFHRIRNDDDEPGPPYEEHVESAKIVGFGDAQLWSIGRIRMVWFGEIGCMKLQVSWVKDGMMDFAKGGGIIA